jgi:hypothetical protein
MLKKIITNFSDDIPEVVERIEWAIENNKIGPHLKPWDNKSKQSGYKQNFKSEDSSKYDDMKITVRSND